jgi:hypothetical protein
MESHEAIKLEEEMAEYLRERLGKTFKVSMRHNGERMISLQPYSFKIGLGAGSETTMSDQIKSDLDEAVVKPALEAAMTQLIEQLEGIEESYKKVTGDK